MNDAPEAVLHGAPHDTELAAIVRSFPAAKVMVLGDVILDRYVNGQASRLSPEAPIPVLRPRRSHATLGGPRTWP
jgi:D-beta-D-heptose 7-phosphate kinase/D-beta-D-heptose 1-phosphate adenosyltransferase